MTNKGINPLYVSALDVLIGTLGVFIVLNFLHSRLLNANPPATQTPLIVKTEKPGEKSETTALPSKPANGNNGSWWRRTFGVSEKPPEPTQPKPSVFVQLAAFATGVPLDIYEFHLYTENSTNLSDTQAKQF